MFLSTLSCLSQRTQGWLSSALARYESPLQWGIVPIGRSAVFTRLRSFERCSSQLVFKHFLIDNPETHIESEEGGLRRNEDVLLSFSWFLSHVQVLDLFHNVIFLGFVTTRDMTLQVALLLVCLSKR